MQEHGPRRRLAGKRLSVHASTPSTRSFHAGLQRPAALPPRRARLPAGAERPGLRLRHVDEWCLAVRESTSRRWRGGRRDVDFHAGVSPILLSYDGQVVASEIMASQQHVKDLGTTEANPFTKPYPQQDKYMTNGTAYGV